MHGPERATRRRRGGARALVVAGIVLLAACGGSSSGGSGGSGGGGQDSVAAQYGEGLASAYSGRIATAFPELSMPSGALACATTKWVELLGVDRFEAADLSPADVSDPGFSLDTLEPTDAEVDAMARAVTSCGLDPAGMFSSIATTVLTPEQITCIDGRLSLDPVAGARILTLVLLGRDVATFTDELAVLAGACNIELPTTQPPA